MIMSRPDSIPSGTTSEPSAEPELAGIVLDNIRSLAEIRKQMKRMSSLEHRVVSQITHLAGNMKFVYAHAVIVVGWIAFNSGVLGFHPFDPYPFGMLAMIASVEAIFVSTFVLISQNRMARIAERHAELDLQVNLLAEHEITRLIQITDAIAMHLGVKLASNASIDELKAQINPDQVLEEMAKAELED